MKVRTTRVTALAAAIAMAVTMGACGSSGGGGGSSGSKSARLPGGKPGRGKPPITLGDKNFTEQFLLGELYKQALEAKGYTVRLKANIGSSELIDKALTSGKLDVYPEYTGVLLSELAHQTKRPGSAQAAYEAAKAFEEKRGFTLLAKTPFVDTDAIAVKPAYASKNGLKTVADLKKLGSSVTLGGAPEFRTRFEGLVGMSKVYGIDKIRFKPLTIGLQYKALSSGAIQAADVFTTDGQLQAGSYKVLSDPKNVFGFQNVAPVVSRKVLQREGPAFAQILNAVSAKLTTKAMQKMNGAVDLDKQDPAAVASTFLKANGLK